MATTYFACPGRAKLGDGTVGATALHATESYQLIVAFLAHVVNGRVFALRPHGSTHRADVAHVDDLIDRLSDARNSLALLIDLSDEQLAIVPAASDVRFSDGQRRLADVTASLLLDQGHQVDAIATAVA